MMYLASTCGSIHHFQASIQNSIQQRRTTNVVKKPLQSLLAWLHLWFGSSNWFLAGSTASSSSRPSAVPGNMAVSGRQASSNGMQWKNQTATKGLIAPIGLGPPSQGKPLGGPGQRLGSMPMSQTNSNPNPQPVQHQHSLI